MITIIYSTHKDSEYNNKFRQHLLESVGLKDVQILEYQNNNQYSLSQVYNSGITKSIYDIVVCCHNDIKLEKGWGKKLLKDFQDNPEYGIIGKAGSCYFPESGVYWERMQQTMVGQVYHHPDGQKKWLNTYSPKLPFLIPVVTVDGLFISFDKRKIKHKFDETIGKFHFYDHPFCLSNYLEGVKLGITSSFEITHQSVGRPNQEFFDSKELFLKKYKNNLPLDLKPNGVYVPDKKYKKIKTSGKVAIIIPTKSNLELLFTCINSFYENCDKNIFDFFIADTGSSIDEKNNINEFIKSKNNIKLIEFNYYNFAKINNEVVKKYVDNSYEFLLFCNNDIKILNDVITGMISVFNSNPNAGTVGCRLHFKDNTIQHNGVILYFDQQNNFRLGHSGLFSYYNFNFNVRKLVGNTAALMMIRKNTFERVGFFNESYNTCFEDVELNLTCLLSGYENYYDGSLVAYHYESQTRGKNDVNSMGERQDYINNLYPFVQKNLDKIKNKTKSY